MQDTVIYTPDTSSSSIEPHQKPKRKFEEEYSADEVIHSYKEKGTYQTMKDLGISHYILKNILTKNKVEPNLCACGCGSRTSAKNFREIINGHNNKEGRPQTEESKKKISEKAKQRFASGQPVNCKIYDIPTKEDLDYLYNDRGYSMNKLSDMMNTSIPTLRKWLHDYGFETREISESLKREFAEDRIGYNSYQDPEFQRKLRQKSGLGKSSKETDIIRFIIDNTHLSEDDIIQTHFLENLEIDIFIPSLNMGIEFNGLYWHTDKYRKTNLHVKKTKACVDNGIFLLHIWEDDWLQSEHIIKRKILYLINGPDRRVFARKCKIKEIQTNVAGAFLQENHLQGHVNSTVYYGMFFGDELVCVASFIERKEDIWELTRFCGSCSVIGGFSKMVRHFSKKHLPVDLYSFADLSMVYENDNVYKNNGWVVVKKLPPDYKYLYKGQRVHKFNFRHSALRGKLKDYDPSLSETVNCMNNGIYKIWDCGKIKYALTV